MGTFSYLFIYFFNVSGDKNDPKNTNISKKIRHFWQKNFGKIFWLILQNFSGTFLDSGKKRLILQDFGKIMKNKILPIWKIWVGCACKIGFVAVVVVVVYLCFCSITQTTTF